MFKETLSVPFQESAFLFNHTELSTGLKIASEKYI